MLPRASHGEGERSSSSNSVDSQAHLRRFMAALASRAARLGSRDPESAVQEMLKRSLQNPAARVSIEFYFSQDHTEGTAPGGQSCSRLGARYRTNEEQHVFAATLVRSLRQTGQRRRSGRCAALQDNSRERGAHGRGEDADVQPELLRAGYCYGVAARLRLERVPVAGWLVRADL
jgi:hypothetical protein